MSGFAWTDVAIGIVVAFGALGGLRRGLIDELTGLVALAFGIAAAVFYGGMWDRWFVETAHVAPGAAHVVGMLAYGAVAYGIVRILGGALATVTRLPLIGMANRILGAAAGAAKSAAFVWAIVYVALFFPLPEAVRKDLHTSALAQVLARPNELADAKVRASLPDVARPFGESLFAQHHI